jgi:hypothetical protein
VIGHDALKGVHCTVRNMNIEQSVILIKKCAYSTKNPTHFLDIKLMISVIDRASGI